MTSIAAEEHLSDDTVLDVSSGENAKRDDAVGVQGVTDLAETVDDSAADTLLSIPLGSVLQLTAEFICTTSPSEADFLRELIGAGNEQVSVLGRLHLSGERSQRAVTTAYISIEPNHCENQTCARLKTDKGNLVTLRFELSPDVVTNAQPLLSLEIRSRRTSQKKKLSLWIALPHLLKTLTTGIECFCSLQLVDDQERVCGCLNGSFRCGLQIGLDNSDQSWTTVVHKPNACILTIKLSDLQSTGNGEKGISCIARIWSSTTGKTRGQTISPLIWKNDGVFAVENRETKAVSLKVIDTATDVLFIGIYQFSTYERNELIGLGSFSICTLLFTAEENLPIEQRVRLYSESTGKDSECGSVVVSLQTAGVLQENEPERSVSLAASGLATFAYPVQSAEMKCRFDIDVLEVRGLPSKVSEGDTITIQLRIAQSNWKAELSPVNPNTTSNGDKGYARVVDRANAVICWSAKDRSCPVLDVSVYVQSQRQPKLIKTGFRPLLATSSHRKRRQDNKNTQRANDVASPVLIATGNLDLSSFYSQQNVSVTANLQLNLEQGFMENNPEGDNVMEKVAVLSRLRASSCQDDCKQLPTPLENVNLLSQPVKGDVCIHLLQASGSAFRQASSVSTYYVSFSFGLQEIESSCCAVDDSYALTWNQHLVLPAACADPPVIYLTLYHRPNGTISSGEDEIIGYLTLPIFPSVLEEDHLVQFELPFGMPLDRMKNDATKQKTEPYYYKRGTLALEMQFLPAEQPKTGTAVPPDTYELVIHQVRGGLQSPSASLRPSGVKHVFIEVTIITDRGGAPEELAVGATGIISISSSGLTEVGEIVDLSNPMVAAALISGPNYVIVGRIRDLTGNNYGRVHLPLRKDWKERLVNRKKLLWYPVCIDENNADVTATKDAVLMSLQVRQQKHPTTQANTSGKFHVNICEAILTTGFESSNLTKLGKYGGANVQLSKTDSNTTTRSRTRQSTDQPSSHHWRWENEWFVFTHEDDEPTASQELLVSLQIGVQSNQPRLDAILNFSSAIEDAKLMRHDLWIPARAQSANDEDTASAHIHIVVVYVPTIIGILNVDFGESYTFSENERLLHVEKIFYKCNIHDSSYCSAASRFERGMVDEQPVSSNRGCERLRLPLNTSLDITTEMPEFIIQRMGATKTLGEICLGVFSIDLLSISDLCSFAPSAEEGRERFTWCEFADKSDRTKTTGVAKMQIGFEEARSAAENQVNGTVQTLENRVISAELFTIWKKLFYLLDQNGNGYIDRIEFTDVFTNHLEEMEGTSDGQKLLQLLFGDNSNQNIEATPTQQQIATLFSIMDTNRDNEIEWSEYLRFLQQRQQQLFTTTTKNDENPAIESPEEAIPQQEQKRELRKKNREDQRTAFNTDNESDSGSNRDEIPPEREREVTSQLKPEPAPPKRSNKVSSSEEKLLKLQYSNQEQSRLQNQINSLEMILSIERRRYAELAADRQSLIRSYQQLHLKHQNELIQEQTKAKWMKQTIERQQQQLEEREKHRQNRNQASIVLQSTVRSRLELKRYQGLKLQRSNAAIVIQCMVRCRKALKQFVVLQESDRVAKQRIRAASRMQRFIRFHVHRKEYALLAEARQLSATILQKNARRMVAGSTWRSQKIALLKLQCWIRQRLAIKNVVRIRGATLMVRAVVLGWFARWQCAKIKTSCRKLQRWWRRASKERSAYLERLEAALCIQSAWKRRNARMWYEHEWQRQETYLSQLEATICIQAAWRGRSVRSRDSTPRFEDDGVIEAMLYDIVAAIEATAPVERGFCFPTTNAGEPPVEIEVEDNVKTTQDPSVLSEQEELAIEEMPTDEEVEIMSVLDGLVDAVISSSDSNVLATESEVPHRMNSTDGIVDQNVSEDTAVIGGDSLREGGSEIRDTLTGDGTKGCISQSTSQKGSQGEVLDNTVDPDQRIIQDLLEHIKDLVASPIVTEDPEGPAYCAQALNENLSHDETQTANASNTLGSSQSSGDQMVISALDKEHQTPPSIGATHTLLGGISGKARLNDNDPATTDSDAPSDNAVDGSNGSAITVVEQRDEGNGDVATIPDEPDNCQNEVKAIAKSRREDEAVPVKEVIYPTTTPPDPGCNMDNAHDSLAQIFNTDTAVGDFSMPNGSGTDDDQDDDSDDDAGGSSIDSTDLMMEADAMATIEGGNAKVADPSFRPRKTERLDSLTLLEDLNQLENRPTSNPTN